SRSYRKAGILEFLLQFFQFDCQYLFIFLYFGQALPELLLGLFLHIHVIVILQLPVVIITYTGFRKGGLMQSHSLSGIPEKMDGEAKNKSPQKRNDNFR